MDARVSHISIHSPSIKVVAILALSGNRVWWASVPSGVCGWAQGASDLAGCGWSNWVVCVHASTRASCEGGWSFHKGAADAANGASNAGILASACGEEVSRDTSLADVRSGASLAWRVADDLLAHVVGVGVPSSAGCATSGVGTLSAI